MRITAKTRKFVNDYILQDARYSLAASEVRGYLSELLRENGISVAGVFARHKGAASLKEKLVRKHYSSPRDQITDLIGARVVTYYEDHISLVVDLIKSNLVIDPAKSIDKRALLATEKFGYRSVHLIVRPGTTFLKSAKNVGNDVFEIQVRSLLEHAWASIQHDTVYKSGIAFPDSFLRRLAAVAGALEIVDREFLALRNSQDQLITSHRQAYTSDVNQASEKLDTGRLIALMEVLQPEGEGWRAKSGDSNFELTSAQTMLDCLSILQIVTSNDLLPALRNARYLSRLARYAELKNVPPKRVSHLAILLLLVGKADFDLVDWFFPAFALDMDLKEVVK